MYRRIAKQTQKVKKLLIPNQGVLQFCQIIPFDSKNYPAWKVKCRIALMKDGVWGIIAKTKVREEIGRWKLSFYRVYQKKSRQFSNV